MKQLTVPHLIAKRLAHDRALLLAVLLAVIVAATLSAVAPVYLASLEQVSFNSALDKLRSPFLQFHVFAPREPLSEMASQQREQLVSDAIERHISDIYVGRERAIRSAIYLVGVPGRPLPQERDTEDLVSRGYLQSISDLGAHSSFVDGRMALSEVRAGQRGPILEAVIGTETAQVFELAAGDELELIRDLGSPTTLTVQIVGVLEPDHPTDEYWDNATVFLAPEPNDPEAPLRPPQGVLVDDEEPFMTLFVNQDAMIDAFARARILSRVSSVWFVLAEKDGVKRWSLSETRERLGAFEEEIESSIPGSDVVTSAVPKLLNSLDQRIFIFKVPLLLLLTVMVATVLLYLMMIISYLAQRRERDASLMGSRGVGAFRLLRLYALEGLVMTAVAMSVAPFAAMALVALAGKLPYFQDVTGGSTLPVAIQPAPFLAAAATGLLSLLVLVMAGTMSARGGLLLHKLRSARPPSLPLFHRYYLDIALLVMGGLTFWELHSRGRFVTGGPFKDVGIDMTLLIAPALFMVMVALVFTRFFSLMMRFASGESPALVHMLAVAVVLVPSAAIVIRETRAGEAMSWPGPVLLLLAVGVVYWRTSITRRPVHRIAGLIGQTALVGALVRLEPLTPGEFLFVPMIGLIALVPAQVMFISLRGFARVAPVWLSMGLRRMARNPLQYTLLMLLLVLVTGLSILATTIGGTLELSQEERIRYDIAADLRVRKHSGVLPLRDLKERYLDTPGIAGASLALRTSGSIGRHHAEVLGLESVDFSYLSWYRPDFSERPLSEIMSDLLPSAARALEIPKGATTIGLWVKPRESLDSVTFHLFLADDSGSVTPVAMGPLETPEWTLMTAAVPSLLLGTRVYLMSVNIYDGSPRSTPGEIRLDDLHVRMEPSGEVVVLEDFEDQTGWVPIYATPLLEERVSIVEDEDRSGRVASFSFGQETLQRLRGLYPSPTAGPMPVVIGERLAEAAGVSIDDVTVAKISGRLVPVQVKDIVRYFPTMGLNGDGFILAELASLLGHVNVLSTSPPIASNELYVDMTPGAFDAGETVAGSAGSGMLLAVQDGRARLAAVREDPLATAGWRTIVVLSLAVGLLTAASGYGVYLMSAGHRVRLEIGFLQSFGLSRRQLLGLLGFEHLAIAAISIGLGTWAGFQMSRLMVAPLAVTETGEPVVPPFVLVTDWDLLIPAFAVMAGAFITSIVVLHRAAARIDPNMTLRLGED